MSSLITFNKELKVIHNELCLLFAPINPLLHTTSTASNTYFFIMNLYSDERMAWWSFEVVVGQMIWMSDDAAGW